MYAALSLIHIFQIKTEGVITYYGDAEIGVTIYIHAIGPANNINFYNTETREVMKIDTGKLQKLTGKGIVASDDIVINTSKGDKSITLIREGVSYKMCIRDRCGTPLRQSEVASLKSLANSAVL